MLVDQYLINCSGRGPNNEWASTIKCYFELVVLPRSRRNDNHD